MHTSASFWSLSSSNAYQRGLQVLCFGVATAVVSLAALRHIIDPADSARCSSLLNHGSWLDTQRTLWQPDGCMLRTYDTQHTASCIGGSRIVMIGDSVTRQLYHSMVKKLLPNNQLEGDRHSDILIQDPDSRTSFEFYWDPWLNTTKTLSLLSGSENRVMGTEEQKPYILLVGTGLWFLRYSEWSGGVEQWQQLVRRLVRQMGNTRLEPLAQHLFISPVPTLNTEKLSEERRRTMLPNDINAMNEYLRDATEESPISVPFSWTEMTDTAASDTDDGLHYGDRVMTAEADILLNFVCNNKLPKIAPMSTTCCFDYPRNRAVQNLMLGIFMVWLPLGFLFQTYFRYHPASSYFPSLAILRSLAVVAAAILYMYFADRTSLFAKGGRVFSASSFTALIFTSIVAGFMTLKRSEKDEFFLNRDQTDEWKGWMQLVILVYHYVAASSVSAIYNPVRMLVASYLFMTGFGHFVFYYKKADFGFARVASILVRLNLLTVLLTYTMDTTYLAYYFAPLVSFFYLVIYGMMFVGHSYNQNPIFIVSKILITSIVTATTIHIPVFMDSAFAVLRFFFGISWSAAEWRFRLQLDVWIVFLGALFAYAFIKAQEMSITAHPHWSSIRQSAIFASVIGLVGYFLFEASMQKFEYNHWHPYISWVPILSFVVLRNSTARLRNTVSTFYTFIGKCSLETFICQFHMWLAGDTKGVLIISPWSRGAGSWTVNLALSTFLFFTIAHVLSGATGELSDWLVTGREPRSKKLAPLVQAGPLSVRTTTRSKDDESQPTLPVVTKRQSVMVSPIAASAGAVGPAALKSMMETSLELEARDCKPTASPQSADLAQGHRKDMDPGRSPSSSKAAPQKSDSAKDSMVLMIDTDADFDNSAPSSATPITFKSLWAKPIWKVGIFLSTVWVLNYCST